MRIAFFVVATVLACTTVCPRADAQTSATPPARPVLVIQSTPGGAQVYVDDELLGTTSPEGRLRISTLKAGKHTLRVVLGGNSYGEGQFTLVAGKSFTKAVTLGEKATVRSQEPIAQPPTRIVSAEQPQQSGPTLVDTVNWIGQQISNSVISSTWQIGLTYAYSDFQTRQNGCSLQWTLNTTTEWLGNPRVPPTPPQTKSFPTSLVLSTLAPTAQSAKIDIEGGAGKYSFFSILFRTSSGEQVTFRDDAYGLKFPDQDIGTRVATAFNHAIELCGGKKEPF